MDKKERIIKQIKGEEVDRIPKIGGWNLGVQNICDMAGIDRNSYAEDPYKAVIKANQNLGVDGITPPVIPTPEDELRNISLQEKDFDGIEPEAVLEKADSLPDSESAILAEFDATRYERHKREQYEKLIEKLDDLVLIPTLWSAPASFSFYFEFGYEAYLAAIALYPEAVEKLYWHSGILARARNEVRVNLYSEFDLPPILLCGDDICTAQGPLCSPLFLKEHYWKYVKDAMEPFAKAGIRFIHHCDGNVMPLVDDMLASGFSGFQGFQYEFGVDPYILKEKAGDIDLLFLGGLSITYTLPSGTEDDIKAEVEYAMDYTDGGKGLFLFTSNVTGIDVPAKNLMTAYNYLDTLEPGWQSSRKKTTWPWLQKMK